MGIVAKEKETMKKQYNTKIRLDELTSKDLFRIPIGAERVYLARRDGKEYLQEEIYELCISSKDGREVMFATEDDFFGFKFYDVSNVEFIETQPLVEIMKYDGFKVSSQSEFITQKRFTTLFGINFNKAEERGFNFGGLVKLNAKLIKDQKEYANKLKEEFEKHQEYLNKKAPILGL